MSKPLNDIRGEGGRREVVEVEVVLEGGRGVNVYEWEE